MPGRLSHMRILLAIDRSSNIVITTIIQPCPNYLGSIKWVLIAKHSMATSNVISSFSIFFLTTCATLQFYHSFPYILKNKVPLPTGVFSLCVLIHSSSVTFFLSILSSYSLFPSSLFPWMHHYNHRCVEPRCFLLFAAIIHPRFSPQLKISW